MNRIAILNRKAATIQMSLRVRDLYRDLPTPSTILAGTSAQPSWLSFRLPFRGSPGAQFPSDLWLRPVTPIGSCFYENIACLAGYPP